MDFSGKNSRPKHYVEHVEKCKKFQPFILNGNECKFCKKEMRILGHLFVHIEKMHAKEVDTEMKKQKKNFQCSKGAFIKYVCSFSEKWEGNTEKMRYKGHSLKT